MTIKQLLIASITALSLSQPALAGDFSIGVNVGQASSDLINDLCEIERTFIDIASPGVGFSCTTEDSDTSSAINVGYHFNDTWGLELGYMDLGEHTGHVSGNGRGRFLSTGTNDSLPTSIELSAIYFLLVTSDLSTLVARDLSGFVNLAFYRVVYEAYRMVTGAQTHAIRTSLRWLYTETTYTRRRSLPA
jgi:hypothetical protein